MLGRQLCVHQWFPGYSLGLFSRSLPHKTDVVKLNHIETTTLELAIQRTPCKLRHRRLRLAVAASNKQVHTYTLVASNALPTKLFLTIVPMIMISTTAIAMNATPSASVFTSVSPIFKGILSYSRTLDGFQLLLPRCSCWLQLLHVSFALPTAATAAAPSPWPFLLAHVVVLAALLIQLYTGAPLSFALLTTTTTTAAAAAAAVPHRSSAT